MGVTGKEGNSEPLIGKAYFGWIRDRPAMVLPHGRNLRRRLAQTQMLSDTGAGARCPAPACRAYENERGPTLERRATHEREAACAIAGERSAGLGREQTREHDLSVGRNEPRHRRGEG